MDTKIETSKLAILGGRPLFKAELDTYPRPFGEELEHLRKVLESRYWNLEYGPGPTQQLEEEMAEFIGARHVLAVNTGGVALQMSLRALGIEPGQEAVFQVDTCVADAFAVMNAQVTPIFADSAPDSFMLNRQSLESWISPRTRVLIPIHMWGRPEDLDLIMEVAREHNLIILEDACLAFGARWKGKSVGNFGKIGCFSMGCLKALQAGEGGLIVTDDENLWKELKAMRSWGERTRVFGVRDQTELSWNGRPSQFVTAVALAQLHRFPEHIERLNTGAGRITEKLVDCPGIIALPEDRRITRQGYTQFVFKVDEVKLGCSRDAFHAALAAEGVPGVWHGAFEPVNTLSFWRTGRWRTWINNHPDIDFVARNYHHEFANAKNNYDHIGVSVSRDILTAQPEVQDLFVKAVLKVCDSAQQLRDWGPS